MGFAADAVALGSDLCRLQHRHIRVLRMADDHGVFLGHRPFQIVALHQADMLLTGTDGNLHAVDHDLLGSSGNCHEPRGALTVDGLPADAQR
ncbi:hypothetical protein D3C85_1746670 [compost metagenome]